MSAPVDQPPSPPPWADAATVLALVSTVILTARQLRPLAEAGAFVARTGETLTAVPVPAWPRAVAWVGISVAVLLRWRRAALLGVWVAVLFEIVVAALRINGDPHYGVPVDLLAWPLLLAIAAAILLSVSAPVPPGPDPLGRRGRWLLAGAAAVTTLTAMATRPGQAVLLVLGPGLVLSAGVLLTRFSERLTRTDATRTAAT